MQDNKSHYAQYIKAREGFDIIENAYGFATYKITNDECYVRDIFVEKQYRNDGAATRLCDKIKEIARGGGCKWLTGSVVPSAPHSTESMKVVLAYGFQLAACSPDFIILKFKL